MNALERDQRHRPNLFVWNGPVPKQTLDEWLQRRRLVLPEELLKFWRETGGGELFESETMLGPFGDHELGDDVDSVNDWHRSQGMNARYLIVHYGIVITAIRLDDQMWVVLDEESYEERGEYESFDSWYMHALRVEFAARYGLRRGMGA